MFKSIFILSTIILSASCGTDPIEEGETGPKGTGKADCADCVEFIPIPGDAYCDRESISVEMMPVIHANADLGNFAYKYQFSPPEGDLPVVVYMPGGPGGGGLAKERDAFTAVPAGYGLLQTEARGSACNDFNLTDDIASADVFTTEHVAEDILTLLKRLKIDNYVLYGHSYGTVVATVAANRAPYLHTSPKAVVIEGTVGKSFTAEEYLDGYSRPWNFLQQFLTPEAAAVITSEDPTSLGLSAHQWGQSIQGWLVTNPEFLIKLINLAFDPESEENQAAIDSLAAFGGADAEVLPGEAMSGPYASSLFQAIACSQLWELNVDFSLKSGQLVEDLVLCKGDNLTSTYDSASYLVNQTPIFYLQGRLDPATTMQSATYHRDNQTSTTRHWFQFNSAGHNILSSTPFSFADHCKTEFWAAVSGDLEVENAVSKCSEIGDTFEYQLSE